MIYRLYDLILCLAAFVLVPYYLIRGLRRGRVRRGLRERMGVYPAAFVAAVRDRQLIWVHAVSVGETRAAIPLLKALRESYPQAVLLLSNTTETGREVALTIEEVDHCIFFPFDLSWVVRRILSSLRPNIVVLVETELWPNFIAEANKLEIPVVMVNGRISDRSFPRYRKAGRLLDRVIPGVSSFCMQSAQDGRRIRHLGAVNGRVQVTGNVKFDMAPPALPQQDEAALRDEFSLPSGGRLLVAGSTHAGEEEILASVYRRLLDDYPALFLVLVPRHPERSRPLLDELRKQGVSCALRTEADALKDSMVPGGVLVVDTIGEVLKLYAIADIVFVGGSLVPTGGHNILEASLMKKPVMFGPYMQNFKEIAKLVRSAHGGLQVKDGDDLYRQLRLLFDNPDEARRIGDNGYRLLEENRGATARTVEEIGRRIID
jgi:3-deoxy-D-manno-octulosonic-acid transferase